MKNRITTTTLLAACVAGFFAVSQQAGAVATIQIDVGNNGTIDFSIADGSALDEFATTGVVKFTAPTATGVLSITTGTTKPAAGSATSPALGLRNITFNGPAGVYALYFSETDFGPTSQSYFMDLALNPEVGTTADIQYTAYSSSSNTLFATDDAMATINASTSSAAASHGSGTAPLYVTSGSPFSLTQKLVITITSGDGDFSASADLDTVPDGGASVALLGLSLLGLHGIRRKFANA